MMRFLLPVLLVLGVVGVAAAQAVPATNASAAAPPAASAAAPVKLYSATVPVAGTSDAQRDAAIANALTQVLLQVAPGVTASQGVLAQASGYVRDFHYRRAASGNGLELQVDFDPGAVGRLIAADQGAAPGGNTEQAGATAAAAATAAPAAQGGSGTLWVGGIGSSDAFASLLSTLRGDPELHDVTPVAAQGDGVLLRLDFDQSLATALAGLTGPGGHLTVAVQPHLGADASLHWHP